MSDARQVTSMEAARITRRLKTRLGVEATSITPVGIEHNCLVRIVEGTYTGRANRLLPGCAPLPSTSTVRLVTREYALIGLSASPRIESEVSALELARRSGIPVPKVYDWAALTTADGEDANNDTDAYGDREGGIGWMVIEFVEGEDMIDVYQGLEKDTTASPGGISNQKLHMLEEFARMSAAIKSIRLPDSITIGGFAFAPDDNADIVSGPLPTGIGGPFSSIQDKLRRQVSEQLRLADEDPYMREWRGEGEGPDLRARIDEFISGGRMNELLAEMGELKPTTVHGDLDMRNIRWDRTTQSIVCIFDLEFAHTATAVDEYLTGYGDVGGCYEGPFADEDANSLAIFDASTDASTPLDLRLWNTALRSIPTPRLDNTTYASTLTFVTCFAQDLCPWWFHHPKTVARIGPAGLKAQAEETRIKLTKYMDTWGVP